LDPRGVHNSFFIVYPLNKLASGMGLTRVSPRLPNLERTISSHKG
jgi:hypothetical protein